MKFRPQNLTKRLMAVAAILCIATTTFAGDIPGAANAKVGDIGRHETASDVNEWVNPENGVYGLHVFAADENPWDSQFFIVFADEVVPAGTPIQIKFEYRKAEGSGTVKFNAQGHANPHAYVNNDGWGELEATEEWQTYEGEEFVASGEIRTFAVNASNGRENGTLYMRNIVITVDYDEVVVTKETTADEADMEEAPIIEVPPTPVAAPHSTVVEYDKIKGDTTAAAVAEAVFVGRDAAASGGNMFVLDKTVKYGDDKVFAFFSDYSVTPNTWDVRFFAHWEKTGIDTTGCYQKVLSFDYKVDFEAAGAWNVVHDNIATGAGILGAKWGAIQPTTEWKHFEDTITENWFFELHLSGRKTERDFLNWDDPYNIFLKNVVLTVDGKVVAKSNDLPTVTGTEVADKIFREGGLIYQREESELIIIGYDNNYWHASDASYTSGISIQNTVTQIADGAFMNWKNLEDVTIPNSVKSIGKNAFYGCEKLKEVTIPNSVTKIEEGTFNGCTSLTSVTISKSVTSIGDAAFANCTSLSEITIPESVTSIGQYAFYNCGLLTSANIGSNVDFSNESLFFTKDGIIYHILNKNNVEVLGFDSSSGKVTIPNTVTAGNTFTVSGIKGGAFRNCSNLTEVTIPESVTSIGDMAFAYCSDLKTVSIPNSVKTIGSQTFLECTSLTNVTIPSSVTSVGYQAFAGCTGLESVSIPKTMTKIEEEAFAGCTSLGSISLPNSVTSIGANAFAGVKVVCYSGSAVGSPWGAENVIKLDDFVFDEDDKTIVVGYVGNSDYLVIPDGVTSIADDAFSGKTNIKTVVLPESVTNIGSHAFYGCNKLESVNIPDKVKSIGNNAFCNCNKLEMVTIPKGTETIGSSAFKGVNTICYSGEAEGSPWGATRVSDENGLIFDNSDNTKLIAYIGTGSKVEIPNGTTTIDEEVFSGCTKLTSVTIPKSVTSIGSHAFYGCTGLKSAAIPESVTEIGSSAFYNCSNLDMMAIPKTVTTIGTDAFKGVKNIINMSDVADSQWGAESVYTIPHDTVYMKDTIIEYVHDTIHVKDTVTQISQLRDTIRIHEYVTEYVHDTIYMFRGVAVNDKAVKLNIYPNPTPSYVTVECETEFSYVLTTSTGTPLRRGEGLSLYVVDLSDYADGVYLLYTSDGELYKIIKE